MKLIPIAVLCFFSTLSFSQKIGYADLEIILAYMPESKVMEEQLKVYEKQLEKKLKVNQSYYEEKYNELIEKAEAGAPADEIKQMEAALIKIQNELKQAGMNADRKLSQKRMELLTPILDKLQDAMDTVSEAEGYVYVLNKIDGSGASIILKGPKEHDLTKRIMRQLGIKIDD